MTVNIISVDNLGKRYRIKTRSERHHYSALRDVIADGASNVGRRIQAAIVNRPWHASSPEPRTASHEDFWALRNASFEIAKGDVVGVIGRNGAGKSTLLKILSRITEPSEGRVTLRGRVASLLEVGTGFHPELTGRENIFLNGAILGMTRADIRARFDEIVAFAEVDRFLDTPVKRYSSGMYVRLAFAIAAHLEPEVLVVDEVLAVGDVAFQKKCMGKMKSAVREEGRTVIFVSHNTGAVANLCRTGLVLEGGRIVFSGTAATAIDYYARSMDGNSGDARDADRHVIFALGPGKNVAADFVITRVEMLDAHGSPKPVTSTWDDVTLRISYRASRTVYHGSVVLQVASFDGAQMFVLSTQPDGTLPVTIEPGEHAVECAIRQLPLAAGEYILGAGLAVPNVEWLYWQSDLAKLTIHPKDIYGSGVAPHAPRSYIALSHRWSISGT